GNSGRPGTPPQDGAGRGPLHDEHASAGGSSGSTASGRASLLASPLAGSSLTVPLQQTPTTHMNNVEDGDVLDFDRGDGQECYRYLSCHPSSSSLGSFASSSSPSSSSYDSYRSCRCSPPPPPPSPPSQPLHLSLPSPPPGLNIEEPSL
ncbi:unnamed protein product, partial [Scytosiphon promiscuus]